MKVENAKVRNGREHVEGAKRTDAKEAKLVEQKASHNKVHASKGASSRTFICEGTR
jgi:hypothetical protein